ncbi:MAG TPA: transglycosylase SLT domain-containing protein, partial [Lamprocystis sp. (in: g-proteobacteria)]|nr:transglycosylase SLT domain-containing protein [Lamprocystis sp. (in: g-proteobacteria)]
MTATTSTIITRPARHWRWVPYAVGGLTLTAILTLGGCGGGGGQREIAGQPDIGPMGYGSSSQFPVPPEIEPNVDFWRHVYGVWSRNQVAFHDDEHMGVIYEVVRLPDAGSDGYTESQKAFIRSRTEYHKDRLRDLERRVASNQTLSSEDRDLLAKFERDGGARALYGAADRVHSQRGLRERFRRGMEISGRYEPAFREVMRANGLPEDLVYLPHVESSYQTNARSSAGAAGVWQFMPATGRIYMKVNGVVDDRYDPILSANGAARYLSEAHQRLGSWPLAITSYNHGQGGMAKAKSQFGHNFGKIVKNYQGKAFKFASRNYYAEFLAAREVAGHPDRYFPEGVQFQSAWPHDRIVLRDGMPADYVARHYGVSTAALSDLNLHWRDPAKSGRAALPAGTTVWLPAGSKSRVASLPSSYSGAALMARNDPQPMGQPAKAAAASLAFRAVEAEPVFASLPRSAPVAEPIARPEPKVTWTETEVTRSRPKVARIEPKTVEVEERSARPEPKPTKVATKVAKAEPKAVKDEPKVAKTEPKTSRTAKAEPKTAKAEPKAAKPEPKTAKAEPKVAKPEPKT